MPVVGAVILVELLFADSGLVPSVADALGLPMVDMAGRACGVWRGTAPVLMEKHRLQCDFAAGRACYNPGGTILLRRPGRSLRLAEVLLHHHTADVVLRVIRPHLLVNQRFQVFP